MLRNILPLFPKGVWGNFREARQRLELTDEAASGLSPYGTRARGAKPQIADGEGHWEITAAAAKRPAACSQPFSTPAAKPWTKL
jgi:hypothetical protein